MSMEFYIYLVHFLQNGNDVCDLFNNIYKYNIEGAQLHNGVKQ